VTSRRLSPTTKVQLPALASHLSGPEQGARLRREPSPAQAAGLSVLRNVTKPPVAGFGTSCPSRRGRVRRRAGPARLRSSVCRFEVYLPGAGFVVFQSNRQRSRPQTHPVGRSEGWPSKVRRSSGPTSHRNRVTHGDRSRPSTRHGCRSRTGGARLPAAASDMAVELPEAFDNRTSGSQRRAAVGRAL